MSVTKIQEVPLGALRADGKISRARSQSGAIEVRERKGRNSQKSQKAGLRFYAPPPPPRPIVAAQPLTGAPISFIEFLFDDECRDVCSVLFGTNTSAERMLGEFRKATEIHYYGHRRGRRGQRVRNPGLLNGPKAAGKKSLRQFVHLAYRGDPDRRGVKYWGKIAALLWETHRQLMALRQRAERAKLAEIARIEKLPGIRAKRATYMRKYRKRRRR